jgi:hypothetical protein
MGRRTRFIVKAHAVTALVHALPTLALVDLLGAWNGVLAGAGVWACVAARLHRLGDDRRKPRWVTRLVDEPVYAHAAACLLGFLLWPLATLVVATISASPLPRAVMGAAAPTYLLALLVAAWGTWVTRKRIRIHRVELSFADLPPAFDGFCITQLSDLHIGSYDPRERGLAWAKLANSLGGDLTVVTGDLVTAGTTFYPDVTAVIAELQAPCGVVVAMGNHDQWDNDALTALLEERNITVLKNHWLPIARGDQVLVVAGLGDAFTGKDDLAGTLAGRQDSAFTVLLSHYPRFFEQASAAGVQLTLSGHTHGGQLGVPWFADRWNMAVWLGQRPRGTFSSGAAFLHVNAGLGTTGPPLRVGVRPEISVITLRRASVAC